MLKWIKYNIPLIYEVDRFIKNLILKLLKRNLKKYDRERDTDIRV